MNKNIGIQINTPPIYSRNHQMANGLYGLMCCELLLPLELYYFMLEEQTSICR
jgi:hypothetical protein